MELINDKIAAKKERVAFLQMKEDLVKKDIQEKKEALNKRELIEKEINLEMPQLELEPDQFHSQPQIEANADKYLSDYKTQ